jgi:hypothetical protein
MKCGQENESGMLYCARCGNWLSSWRPIQATETEPPPAAVTLPATPAQVNTLAMAGLICGIIGFFFFGMVLGPAGIVLGAIALFRIHSSRGRQGGKGLAIAAIVISAISFIGALVVVIFYLPQLIPSTLF